VNGNTEVLVNTTNTAETVASANVSAANMEIVLVGIHLGLKSAVLSSRLIFGATNLTSSESKTPCQNNSDFYFSSCSWLWPRFAST
jgi:hypothetical protein